MGPLIKAYYFKEITFNVIALVSFFHNFKVILNQKKIFCLIFFGILAVDYAKMNSGNYNFHKYLPPPNIGKFVILSKINS